MFTFGAGLGKLTAAGTASVTWGVTVRHLSRALQKHLQDLFAASRAQCGGPCSGYRQLAALAQLTRRVPKRLGDTSAKTLANSLVLKDYWLEDQPLWQLQFNVTGQSERLERLHPCRRFAGILPATVVRLTCAQDARAPHAGCVRSKSLTTLTFKVHLHDLSFFHMR